MTAEYSVLDGSSVTDGPNLGIRDRKKRIRTNSRGLSTATVGIRAHHRVHTDYSYQTNDAGALNGAVPQCQGSSSCLASIRLHRNGNVFEPVVDEPTWDCRAQRQYEDFPRDADA